MVLPMKRCIRPDIGENALSVKYKLTPKRTFLGLMPAGMLLAIMVWAICFWVCLFLLRNASLTIWVGSVVFGWPIFMVPPKSAIAKGVMLFSKLMTKNSREKYCTSNLLFLALKYAVSSASESIQFFPEINRYVGIWESKSKPDYIS